MPVRKPRLKESGIYFITFTNYSWLPLIQLTNGYDLVYKWFDVLTKKGHAITGYVVMPNHVHALICFNKPQQTLDTVIGNGKRFMAYEIVQRLGDTGNIDILEVLSAGVEPKDKSRGKLHEVFRHSFDIKECHTIALINQKLDYIHNNPLTGKWALAKDTVSYPHSSARYYETGVQGIYPVTNFIDVLDKDWE